jgi:hypothetical protein
MPIPQDVNTQYQELDLQPGINKNNTPYGNEGRWIDGDKVRFRDGRPRKIGGWERQTTSVVGGVPRNTVAWSSLDSEKYLGIGTHKTVEIFSDGEYFDVTPIRAAISSVSAISTSAGSNQVQVLVSTHDATVGDSIELHSQATVATNVFFDGTYEITSVVDADNVIVEYATAATSSVSNAGTVSGYTILQNGLEFNQVAYGWGAGAYSTGTFGTPRTASTLITSMRQWTFDTWGEDLIACNRGAKIYVWDETNGLESRLVPVTAAPSRNNSIIISYPTRHLISLGTEDELTSTYDPMLVRWCSSEDYNDWQSLPTNSAGSQRLEKGNKLVGSEPSKNDILVFSDTASYSMRYRGYPFIFGFDLIGEGSGLVSPNAAINVDGVVYWMSNAAFYRYDGSLRTLDCTVRDVIFDVNNEQGLNQSQKDMVFCGLNQEFTEIIWLYPSRDSTKCDRYVILNYKEGSWYDGSLDRSVWQAVGTFNKPLAISRDGVLYAHEQGKDDDGSPMEAFIESGQFDLGSGDEVMYIDKFIPDFNQVGNLTVTIKTRKYPQSGEFQTKEYVLTPSSGKLNTRARGRQATIKYNSNTAEGDFTVGKPRLAIKPDGARG